MAVHTAGFMTHVTCRLTAKNRDQLRDPALGNRIWATFTFLIVSAKLIHSLSTSTASKMVVAI